MMQICIEASQRIATDVPVQRRRLIGARRLAQSGAAEPSRSSRRVAIATGVGRING